MKKAVIMMFFLILFAQVFFTSRNVGANSLNIRGNINGDGSVDLQDAVLTLQSLSGLNSTGIRADYVSASADVNNNGKVGMDETLYILQLMSGLRVTTPGSPTNVTVVAADPQTVGGRNIASSTRLAVSWSAPSAGIADHYEVTAVESIQNTQVSITSTTTSATLTGLKAGTTYAVTISACGDPACTTTGVSSTVNQSTAEEYWQLQGSGNSYTTLTTTVKEGSVLSWVMRWSSAAGASYAGRYQYYYKTNAVGREGIGIAATSGTGVDVATLTSFSPLTATGLRSACSSMNTSACPSSGALEIEAFQAVPMKNGVVRAFFNASDLKDANTRRIYSLDSRDGLVGQDFNSSSSQAYCGGFGSTDYATGGTCTPQVQVNAKGANPLSNARQFKIGYDWNSNSQWDSANGTFMVITGDDTCNKYPNALFYATWNGSTWNVLTDSSGCAKPLVPLAHGPVLVPRGGATFKLYYEDAANGQQSGKPLHQIFADGAKAGDEASVDFADWEPVSAAREVHFLWPDNSLLDAQDEAGLGDHMILTPTGKLDQQFMFVNLGGLDNTKWGKGSYGLGIAVLLNP